MGKKSFLKFSQNSLKKVQRFLKSEVLYMREKILSKFFENYGTFFRVSISN